jgi:hypothetical protein
MTFSQIQSEIVSGRFSNSELDQLIRAILFARKQLSFKIKNQISVGRQVQFTNRGGQVISGRVAKIAVKFATVSTVNGQWKVPINMLQIVA